jgi:hypothetical protein
MTRVAKWPTVKAWAMNIAKRRGAKRAKVALAHKLGHPSSDVDRRKRTSGAVNGMTPREKDMRKQSDT